MAHAAMNCGSNVPYVMAALAVLKSGDQNLLTEVRRGDVALREAAEQVRPLVDLVAAYSNAKPRDRVAFGKAVGPEALYLAAVEPAINSTTTAATA